MKSKAFYIVLSNSVWFLRDHALTSKMPSHDIMACLKMAGGKQLPTMLQVECSRWVSNFSSSFVSSQAFFLSLHSCSRGDSKWKKCKKTMAQKIHMFEGTMTSHLNLISKFRYLSVLLGEFSSDNGSFTCHLHESWRSRPFVAHAWCLQSLKIRFNKSGRNPGLTSWYGKYRILYRARVL